MITKLQYVEFLISTIGNFTSTHLAEHLDGVSHDTITDFLQSERLTARHLWGLVQGLIADSPDAFLIADDILSTVTNCGFLSVKKRNLCLCVV